MGKGRKEWRGEGGEEGEGWEGVGEREGGKGVIGERGKGKIGRAHV